MKFGIFSNQHRHLENIAESWRRDIREIVVADAAGLEEAWISEHTGLSYLKDAMPCAEQMIAKAAALTTKIRMGTAVRRIALYPPQLVALEGATCDHLTDGRYMLGVGVGGPVANHAQWGLTFENAQAMTAEGIDLVVRCWEEPEPFDYEGKFYRGKQINLYPKPLQRQIPVAVATGAGLLMEKAAMRGFRFLTSQYARAANIGKIAANFDGACRRHTGIVRRRDVTACRAIFVADTDSKAFRQAEPGWRAQIEYIKKLFTPLYDEYIPPGGTIDDVSFEHLIEQGQVFIGSPATVIERFKDFYDGIGGFGTFLMSAGKDWGTEREREDMYHLFAEAVVPKLRHLDDDLDAVPPADVAQANLIARSSVYGASPIAVGS